MVAGETSRLIESFRGEPELHHPIRGRIKGITAFTRFIQEMGDWLREKNYSVDILNLIVTGPRSVEEVVLTLDGPSGAIDMPIAIVSDRTPDGQVLEMRMYFSTWPLTGSHSLRPPLLQPDPDVKETGFVGDYQRALASGDITAVVASFDNGGYFREPSGGTHIHRGAHELASLYEHFFSNGGGIRLEQCASTDDGRACAVEYNVVGWGRTTMSPQAGIAIYVRGASGKIAAARIYDDVDAPIPSKQD
ncbi:nuclear transport factor 2 family protein [Arthrobacter sp. TS-15]|uniref:nuclear transport factor 2 family protein n=1 Tax=Arthrobacter sp. TS-15 TaxID=2510797 RepID=UPI00135AA396|nr:nuclear transport factor 2 family protein [Arthrobacter sp. TS-15]